MGAKRTRVWEFNKAEAVKALFGEELGSLIDGDCCLDGSNREYHIFSSVFSQTNDLCENTARSVQNACPFDGFNSHASVQPMSGNAGNANGNMDGFVVSNSRKSARTDESCAPVVDGDGCCTSGTNFGPPKGKSGVGPELSGYKPTLLIEYSFLPVGLEPQCVKAKQLKVSPDSTGSCIVGAPSENGSGMSHLKNYEKVENSSIHGSGLVGALSEMNCQLLNVESEEELVHGSLPFVASKAVDDVVGSIGHRKLIQHMVGPVDESAVDVRSSVNASALKEIASDDIRNEQDHTSSCQSYQRMSTACEASNVETHIPQRALAREVMDTDFGNGKLGGGIKLCSTPFSHLESSCAPSDLESQGAEVHSDAPGPATVGASHENDSQILSLELHDKNENDPVHGSGLFEGSSDKSPCLEFRNDSVHSVALEVVSDTIKSGHDNGAGQCMLGPIAIFSADNMTSHDDPAKKQVGLGREHEQWCSTELGQKKLIASEANGWDTHRPNNVLAREAAKTDIEGLKGKLRLRSKLHTKSASSTEHPCFSLSLGGQGVKSKPVKLHTGIPGSEEVAASHENGSGILNSSHKLKFHNDLVHGTVLVDASNATRSGMLSSKAEEKNGDVSVHSVFLTVVDNATESIDNRVVTQYIRGLVAESMVDDMFSHDGASKKQAASDSREVEEECSDCFQSHQKMSAASEASCLHTPSPSDGLAKETIDAKVMIMSPVSQESSAPKIDENNAVVIFGDDIQPLSIYTEETDKRTQEALLLMSEEVKPSWKKTFTAELRVKLFQYVKAFLVSAGFEVQLRHRLTKNAVDSVYVSPGNKRIRYTSAIKAWKASAKMLFCGKNKPVFDSAERKWDGTTEFWADLTDALALVEGEVQHWGHHVASLKRWILFDPFVTMLFIKRLEPLKGREGTKALRRSTNNSHCCRSSKRLATKRRLELLAPDDEPGRLDLSLVPQLESDGSHSQLTESLHIDGSEGLHGTLCRRALNRNSIQNAGMQPLEASSYASPSISFDIVPHDVGATCTSQRCKASDFFVVDSGVEGSQMGVLRNIKVANKQKEAQLAIFERGSNHKNELPEHLWVNEKPSPAQKQAKQHKSVQHVGCRRSSRRKGTSAGTDDGACLAEISDDNQDLTLISKEIFYSKNHGKLRCDVSEGPNFEGPSPKKMLTGKYKEPLIIEANKLCDSDLEVDASPACESRRRFISPGRQSERLKRASESPATKQCKADRKSSLAGTFVQQVTNKTNNKSHDEIHALKKQKLVADDERNSPARASTGDLFVDHEDSWKVVNLYTSKAYNESGRKKIKDGAVSSKKGCRINDDDLLIAAIIKNKDFTCTKQSPLRGRKATSRTKRKLKSQKGGCKLLPRNLVQAAQHPLEGEQSTLHKRTILSWMIDSGALFENELVHYRSPKSGALVKDGWVTRDGLLCKCCNNLFSLLAFKIHAGCKAGRLSLNLFVESGESFTLCQLRAWSAEYKTRKGSIRAAEINEVDLNDDTCGICGDGGVLICCDSCPSTFHHACLNNQLLPEDKWYCPYCICEFCGEVAQQDVLECSQCERKYHKPCLADRVRCEGDASITETWFCGENCQKVYSELRSHIGVVHHIEGGFSWTLLKCIDSDPKVRSVQKLALMAECNTKLAVALTIMEECFMPMIDPRTGIDMIPHVLYSWGSNFARLNYQGFYTVILERGDELISVASMRVHGVVVAELPLVATCSGYRRQGMCRRLIKAIEEMLMSVKVERLVISAIPELIDTWTSAFGFKHIDDSSKELYNRINLMVFPGTTLLEKRLNCLQPFEGQAGERCKVSTERSEVPPFKAFPVLEAGQQVATIQNAKNDMEMESVHENPLLRETPADISLLTVASVAADFSRDVPPTRATPVATNIISDVIDRLETCSMQNKAVEDTEGNHAVDMVTTVTSVSTDDGDSYHSVPAEKIANDIPCGVTDGDILSSKAKDCSDGTLGQESGSSKPDLEGYGNLENSIEVAKSTAEIYLAIDKPRILESCNCGELVGKHEHCGNRVDLTISKSADAHIVNDFKITSPVLQEGSSDGTSGSMYVPLLCTSEEQNHEIAKVIEDHLASVNLSNIDLRTPQKEGLELSLGENKTSEELYVEKSSGNFLVDCVLRLSSSGLNANQNGHVMEVFHSKRLENEDRQIVNLNVDEVSSIPENASQHEYSISCPEVDLAASLDSSSFDPEAETAKVLDPECPTIKHPDGPAELNVMRLPSESLTENLKVEKATVNTGDKAINFFQDNSGEERIARELVRTRNVDKKFPNLFLDPSTMECESCQKPTGNVEDPSKRLNFSPSCRSTKGKGIPSKSYFLRSIVGSGTLAEDQNSPSVPKSAKETSPVHKEIVLGLGCQPFDDVPLKSSSIKGNGGNPKFHDWL
ncbi:uncharacterized protein LOC116266172 [Nymphaea colorata]|nr:uncharacterized protein LOC116266172 [Nymphaea colorata]XP_031503144.1 uncharacterized protein LOC116266172 [Nymphaea colorata]XP_031503145.1 uncharacterized protein LOC116266172 [Nymphaea colorata]